MAALLRASPHLEALRTPLMILVVLGCGLALYATAPVTRPLALALFLAALLWPLQATLERFVPKALALTGTMMTFLGVATGFGWLIAESLDEVQESATGTSEKLRGAFTSAASGLERLGVDPAFLEEPGLARKGIDLVVRRVGGATVDATVEMVLVVAFVGLILLEVDAFRRKIAHESRASHHRRWPAVLARLAGQMQRYMAVRTAIGLMTGAAVGVGALAIGLRFWFIWGLLNFLLNYIPTLGSILGVLPPVLFAWIQFQSPTMVLATLGVVGGVQIIMGNWVDPLLQGKVLALSPLVVLLSVSLWGLIWGMVGALIAVPLTLTVVLTCDGYDRTRPLARLLRGQPPAEEAAAAREPPGEPAATPR